MAVVEGLICKEQDGSISFGNYLLEQKAKVSDFALGGDIYKVKSYRDITKLEKNELFVYESVPGTTVHGLRQTADGMEFVVEGGKDAQITVEMEPEAAYRITIDGAFGGTMKTHVSGKLSIAVELEEGKSVAVRIEK